MKLMYGCKCELHWLLILKPSFVLLDGRVSWLLAETGGVEMACLSSPDVARSDLSLDGTPAMNRASKDVSMDAAASSSAMLAIIEISLETFLVSFPLSLVSLHKQKQDKFVNKMMLSTKALND